jgi:hypothetical protein
MHARGSIIFPAGRVRNARSGFRSGQRNTSRLKHAPDASQTRLNWFFHKGVMWSPCRDSVFVVGLSLGAGRGSSPSPDCFAAVWLARVFLLRAAQGGNHASATQI